MATASTTSTAGLGLGLSPPHLRRPPWPLSQQHCLRLPLRSPSPCAVRAVRRSDFDGFARRVASGEALKDAWRHANDGFARFLYDAQRTAEGLDRRYSVSRRLDSFARSAASRAREIDRDLGLQIKFRSLSLDFQRNWPKYRKDINGFLDTPIGKGSTTLFFLWFALSGWLFRFIIFSTCVLPFAAPLLIGVVANNFVIEFNRPNRQKDILKIIHLLSTIVVPVAKQGACPACKKPFMGYRNQIIRCMSCQSIVWQPGETSRSNNSRSRPGPDIIDVEIVDK